MFITRWSKKRRLFFIIVCIALGSLVSLHSGFHWRIHVLGLKVTGELSALTWREILAGVAPGRWAPDPNHVRKLVGGDIHFRRFEGGATLCPELWETPIGSFWGRLEDGNVLEAILRDQGKARPTSMNTWG